MKEARQCSALRRDGSPCRGRALPSKSVCFAHDESRQAALRESRARGGHGKSKTVRLQKLFPADLRPVLSRLLDALERVDEGTLSPGRAHALAALARAAVAVHGAGQLEERLQALEQAAEGRRAG